MAIQNDSGPSAGRGFVLGELFVAILLLALAISSVSALMYSATRHPRPPAAAECGDDAAADSPRCSPERKRSSKSDGNASKASTAEKLLVAGCATRTGSRVRACKDSVLDGEAPEGTTIRSRTDSASLQLLPRKPKRVSRPDLGFVR